MLIKQFYPYSPRKANFEQLSHSFVPREALLEELISGIRGQADAEALQHWMILGMRGMGKSHLIALIYQTVKTNADLNRRWIPLLMREEEQSVFSLHTLFIRVLTQLGEELETTDKKKCKEIFNFLDTQRKEDKKQEEILESVVAFLKDFVKETGKTLLVLMENSDDIFSRYISKKNDIKKFRNMLQHDNFILLIGTSPTFFDEISKPRAPLYQFFRIRSLELLTYEQSVDLLNRWAKSDDQPSEVKNLPFTFNKDDYKLRALYHLTGGNPRVLLFLYMAIRGQDGIQSAVETFSKLLEEDLSNYYLSRLRDLSNQVQPIILAMAESDKNLTQKEIAQKTFLPMKSIGTAMIRLEKDSLVRPVTEKKGKNTLYTLTDHLFRLWHQWRISSYNKEVIKAVVMCVAVWYKKVGIEQWSMRDDIIGMHCKEALKYRTTAHYKSLWETLHKESVDMIIRCLERDDYQGIDKTLALLQETGIESGKLLGEVTKDLENKGNIDSALKLLEKRLENDNKDKEAWVDLGRVRFNQKDYAAGEAALEKAVKLDPKDHDAWKLLGAVRFNQENDAAAEAALEKAVELDPKDIGVWKLLGAARVNQKNFTGAEEALEKAIELDPKDHDAWKRLGVARINQENLTGAEVAFEKTVELDPKDTDAWKRLGFARIKQDNFAGTEAAFEEAVELNPKDNIAWKLLGAAHAQQDNFAEAGEALAKVVELDPKDHDTWKLLGVARNIQENYTSAEAALEKAVYLDPKNHDAWKWLGINRVNQKNYTSAEAAFKKAVELPPKDPVVWKLLGDALFFNNDYSGAETAFHKHIDINPFEKEVYDNLLEVLVNDNRVSDMLPILDKALSLNALEIDFKAVIHFIRAFVFLYQQDQTPFLKDLNVATGYLKEITEEKKHETLGEVTKFLSDTLRAKSIRIHRTYVAELRNISTDLSGVFRPMDHVLDYFEVIFSAEKNNKFKTDKAQRILDSITEEIRGPVEKMIESIKKNLETKKA